MLMRSFIFTSLLFLSSLFAQTNLSLENLIDPLVQKHPDKTGLYVLEKGGEALLTRGWLADRATKTIDVQYFIWGDDNIGKLAAETLLRAAERGVHVRVLVDDFLLEAEVDEIFAMDYHPNVEIKVYNPMHSVGVNFLERITQMLIDFRGSNQRMHNKMFVVDNKVAITGGRNMENQYFDFGHTYNYRDRDVLLMGKVIHQFSDTFEEYWSSDLSEPVQELIHNPFIPDTNTSSQVNSIYKNLHLYAQDKSNYLPEIRQFMAGVSDKMIKITNSMYWLDASLISDRPGKNKTWFNYDMDGGGECTSALAQLLNSAKDNVVIQSPYLILSSEAWELFEAALARGVKIKISTNSLAASDNLPAFSGYSAQVDDLLDAGIELYEYRHDAKRRDDLVQRYSQYKDSELPIFSLHAKSMVIDDSTVFIGTYNLDPRSENLNTEMGIVAKDKDLARAVKREIEIDMAEGNSWNVRKDGHNNDTSIGKRGKVLFLKFLPLDPIL